MIRDPETGVRLLDRTIDYSDGAEDRMLEILKDADDLSSLSDELSALIDDWPTRYHLARERSNLLRPLRIGPRHRVLEIGAGTGAISRYLGETGATVVALEGSLPRARAAQERCRDLDNVEVVCGALDAFSDPDGFDLVCLIGVLEYAGVGERGVEPARFLDLAAGHLKPRGLMVIAIENQIGLKYLLGYEEDHLGRPWVGLEGYPDCGGVRTHSRRRLGALLESRGLGHQRWLYPFPDYKLPSVIVTDAAYEQTDAAAFIHQVVRSPVAGGASEPALLCDDHRVHRVMLEAGIGREVANSFLVLASAGTDSHDSEPMPDTLAWLFGGQRRRLWIRHQVVDERGTGRRIRAVGPDKLAARADGWLHQDPTKDDPFFNGATIWELATDASRRRDIDGLRDALELWRRTIDRHRTTLEKIDGTNPFLLPDTRETLPPNHLDVCLSNFVVAEDRVDFVDREWIAEPAVDADLVSVRGLWLLAQGLVRSCGIHPWDPTLTVDELTIELGSLAGIDAREHLPRLYEAEAELLHLVSGRRTDDIDADLRWIREHQPTDPEAVRALPITRIRSLLDTELPRLQGEVQCLGSELTRLEGELAHERSTAARLAAELSATHERLGGELSATHERLGGELSATHEELSATHELLTEVGGKLEDVAAALDESNRENSDLRERAAQEAETILQRVLDLERERDELVRRRDVFEARLPIRIWRRIQRLIH